LGQELYQQGFPVDGFESKVDGSIVTRIEHYLTSDSSPAPVKNYQRITLVEFVIDEVEFLIFEKKLERKTKFRKIFE